MSGMQLTWTGAKELAEKLNRLPAAVGGQWLENSLASGALLIANDAKTRAPYRSGTLRRSIHVGGHTSLTPDYNQSGSRAGKGYSAIGGNHHTRTHAEVLVGTNLVYAAIQEYGGTVTPKHAQFLSFEVDGHRVFTRKAVIPARPYLRPAFDTQQDAVVKEIGDALAAQLRKVAA